MEFPENVRVAIVRADDTCVAWMAGRDCPSKDLCQECGVWEDEVYYDVGSSTHNDPPFYIRLVYQCKKGTKTIPLEPPVDHKVVRKFYKFSNMWMRDHCEPVYK
jgi:hypothetical protein